MVEDHGMTDLKQLWKCFRNYWSELFRDYWSKSSVSKPKDNRKKSSPCHKWTTLHFRVLSRSPVLLFRTNMGEEWQIIAGSGEVLVDIQSIQYLWSWAPRPMFPQPLVNVLLSHGGSAFSDPMVGSDLWRRHHFRSKPVVTAPFWHHSRSAGEPCPVQIH